MLRDLRVGTVIYVLNKREPRLEIGEVTDTKISMTPPTFTGGVPQPQRPLVDITATFGTETRNYRQVPADVAIADFSKEGIVITDNKEQMVNEIESLKKLSKRLVDEVDRHKKIVKDCDKLLAELDPQVKEKVQQSQDIENLKAQMGAVNSQLTQITNLLQSLNNKPIGGNNNGI